MSVRVICLTGEDATTEGQIAALEKAIAHMEAEGAQEQAHREHALEGMRETLGKLRADAE